MMSWGRVNAALRTGRPVIETVTGLLSFHTYFWDRTLAPERAGHIVPAPHHGPLMHATEHVDLSVFMLFFSNMLDLAHKS